MLVLDRVSQLVDKNPQAFINGNKELAETALNAAKYMFDLSVQQESKAHLAVTELIRSYEPDTKPVTRSQAKADKERASTSTSASSPPPPPRTSNDIWKLTPIDSLLLDGMDDDQVWAQLELRTSSLCETLKSILEKDPMEDEDEDGLGEDLDMYADEDEDEDEDLEFYGFGDGDEDEEGEGLGEEDGQDEEGGLDESSDDDDLPDKTASLHDPSDEETASEEEDEEEDGEGAEEDDGMDLDRPTPTKSKPKPGTIIIPPSKPKSALKKKKGGHPTLDDDFFSLADFKAEVEEAEAKRATRGRLGDDDDDEDEDLESDLDLFAPVDDTNFDEEDLEAGMAYYNDFFAPPPKNGQSNQPKKKKIAIPKPKKTSVVRFNDEVKVRNIKSTGRGLSVKDMNWQDFGDDDEDEDEDDDEEFPQDLEDGDQDDSEEDDEGSDAQNSENGEDEETDEDEDGEEGRDAIERFKDDLFADDSEDEGPSKNLSTYESRQAEIATQIQQLEEENVAPKSWTLMGEATVRQRPVNSLLEEDLEFERVMKPVPVVTEESVSSLEEMIKKRILDNKFDDVVRKRSVEDKPFLPSRLFELDDKKSSKGLAEIYADEYTAAASGTTTDVRDEKLKQQHTELTDMWEKICYKLDALSNAHFTPKQPKASITTISNIATATMESALPTAVSTTTMLAPEEIYTPDASALRSKEEMTPMEKKSLRNKQRKARKKAQDIIKSTRDKLANSHNKPFGKSVKKEKEKALKSVVKTGKGVSVVGKQSQKPNEKQASGKNLKL